MLLHPPVPRSPDSLSVEGPGLSTRLMQWCKRMKPTVTHQHPLSGNHVDVPYWHFSTAGPPFGVNHLRKQRGVEGATMDFRHGMVGDEDEGVLFDTRLQGRGNGEAKSVRGRVRSDEEGYAGQEEDSLVVFAVADAVVRAWCWLHKALWGRGKSLDRTRSHPASQHGAPGANQHHEAREHPKPNGREGTTTPPQPCSTIVSQDLARSQLRRSGPRVERGDLSLRRSRR